MQKQKVWVSLLALVCLCASRGYAFSEEDYLNGPPLVVPKTYATESELAAMVFKQFEKQKNKPKTTDWGKYRSTLNRLTRADYGCVIRQASEIYGVDPVAIMGSILGEHTYNVDLWDITQQTYLIMVKRWIDRFHSNEINLVDVLAEPKYAACLETTNTYYDRWDCYDSLWMKDPRNPNLNNPNYIRLKWAFFNPFGAGYTYGLGQLGPDRALMVTDVVNAMSGFPILDPSDPQTIYDQILNPKTSIHYVAAANYVSIQIYLEFANFDISQNPGVIATLYNLGKEKMRANERYHENLRSLRAGKGIVWPGHNYFGALVNHKQDEIRAAYEERVANLPESTCRKHVL